MPRIRTVKPEFWSSPGIGRCSLRARLLFIAMWNWADDYGVGTANPRELMGFAFPNDEEVSAKDFPSLRKEVADNLHVDFYTVRERPYFSIPSWNDHQRTERKANRSHPGPEQADSPSDKGESEMRGTSDPTQGTSDAIDGGSGLGTGEQGNRGTGEQPSSSEVADAPSDREDVERLCTQLADHIVNNGSKAVITKGWRDAARLMLDRDARAVDEASRLIDWCQRDEFWRTNILSMPKFREQYDKLRLRANTRAINGSSDSEKSEWMSGLSS